MVKLAEPVLGGRTVGARNDIRRRATSQAALANYDAAVASYREFTLTALQQVEDNLVALRILEQEAQQQKDATASAQESLHVFTDRYIGGADPYLQVLTAQTIALQNERNDVDILRRRMDASVLLIKALGGGWDVSHLPTVTELERSSVSAHDRIAGLSPLTVLEGM